MAGGPRGAGDRRWEEEGMTPNQLIKRRQALFETQAAAAKALGISDARYNHYERARRPVPKWLEKFLDCMEKERKKA
jgi:DNA-binding XRE family transcriptional regulator